MKSISPALAAILLAACSSPGTNETSDVAVNGVQDVPATEEVAATAPADNLTGLDDTADDGQAAYIGRWTGVEGMYLNVAAKPGGGVTMEMQWDLDNRGTFDGSVTAEGLRFVRGGDALVAVRTDGDATGLKYLAGKRDCLTVKAGEGYCRD